MPAVAQLSEIAGVSRTTTLKLMELLVQKGIARLEGPHKIVLRRPVPGDYFSEAAGKSSKADQVERRILQKFSTAGLKPGERFSELELAREFAASTILVREVLQKIARSGFIRKHPHQKWEVIEFTTGLLEEIISARRLYETHALRTIRLLPENERVRTDWALLQTQIRRRLKRKRLAAADVCEMEYALYSRLAGAARNRFLEASYRSLLKLTTGYLRQDDGNEAGLENELTRFHTLVQALLNRDFETVAQVMEEHLQATLTRLKNDRR